ncbi:MAG: hypothetical protein JRJ68_04335 [Deltaproteobacteria bacterium]|nr:hypothetical protein [Deltaproteobacteria bacterium]
MEEWLVIWQHYRGFVDEIQDGNTPLALFLSGHYLSFALVGEQVRVAIIWQQILESGGKLR